MLVPPECPHSSLRSVSGGLEFKVIRMPNDYKQTYACECGQGIHITGTVLGIHYRKADQAGKLADWLQDPAWRIRDSS